MFYYVKCLSFQNKPRKNVFIIFVHQLRLFHILHFLISNKMKQIVTTPRLH